MLRFDGTPADCEICNLIDRMYLFLSIVALYSHVTIMYVKEKNLI